MQLDQQGNLVQNSLLKPGSEYKQHLCALHGAGEFSCYTTISTQYLTAATLFQASSLPFYRVFFLVCSEAVSASSVVGVGWCISHKTKVAEIKVQLQVSSWTTARTAKSY